MTGSSPKIEVLDGPQRRRHWTAAEKLSIVQEEVVAASEYRSLQNQIRELQRLLGKKTLEAEILKEALEVATGPKKQLLRSLSWPKGGSR